MMGASGGDMWKGTRCEGFKRDIKAALDVFRALSYFRVNRNFSHCSTVANKATGGDKGGEGEEEGLAATTIVCLELVCSSL
jgi:hypothetical protein